jgi:excisionase family DNA binding protein
MSYPLLPVSVAAQLCGVQPVTFRKWARDGRIRLVGPGRNRRVLASALMKFMTEHQLPTSDLEWWIKCHRPKTTEDTQEDFPGQNDEYRLQKTVERAVREADIIIMDGSNGSVEETDYLTSKVAEVFAQKAHQAVVARLLRYSLEKRHAQTQPHP